jgi:hypothetical protein
MVRTGSIGLTGFEIITLMRWLDDPAFPMLSEPATPPRRQPRPKTAAPAAPAASAPAVAAPAVAAPAVAAPASSRTNTAAPKK